MKLGPIEIDLDETEIIENDSLSLMKSSSDLDTKLSIPNSPSISLPPISFATLVSKSINVSKSEITPLTEFIRASENFKDKLPPPKKSKQKDHKKDNKKNGKKNSSSGKKVPKNFKTNESKKIDKKLENVVQNAPQDVQIKGVPKILARKTEITKEPDSQILKKTKPIKLKVKQPPRESEEKEIFSKTNVRPYIPKTDGTKPENQIKSDQSKKAIIKPKSKDETSQKAPIKKKSSPELLKPIIHQNIPTDPMQSTPPVKKVFTSLKKTELDKSKN